MKYLLVLFISERMLKINLHMTTDTLYTIRYVTFYYVSDIKIGFLTFCNLYQLFIH